MKPTKSKFNISNPIPILLVVVLGFVFLNSTCSNSDESVEPSFVSDTQNALPITVSSNVPSDIFTDGTPASKASLTQAANFAWNEFIALNWPAKKDNRDVPDTNLKFGSQDGKTPLVWHTYRHKVETYPGNGKAPPGYDPTATDYGYNTSPPSYLYEPSKTGTDDGSVTPCGIVSSTTPWINLDEKTEIGAATMHAGVSSEAAFPDDQILFLAKSNEVEYKYIAKNQWWNGKDSTQTLEAAQKSTTAYIKENGMTPPYDANSKTYVSLPPGTIEVKTAWRKLTSKEINSKRFFSTNVRYYEDNEATDKPCYVDDVFGMVALHIIQKTPTAPYFIYATFEQADNILTTTGERFEDENGNIIGDDPNIDPTTPKLTVTNATPTAPQTIVADGDPGVPDSSLYYINVTGNTTPQGTVVYNQRFNSIPQEIITVNENAHALINDYNTQNNITSPWEFYKLINVQYAPINKEPGVDYVGDRKSEYYLSNSVVESDYVLQMFSGQLAFDSVTTFTSTDYNGITYDSIAYNAYYEKPYLMGGCMGCHGNITNTGSDYSFILGVAVTEPEVAGKYVSLNDTKVKRLAKIMK